MEFSGRNWVDVTVMRGREENSGPGCCCQGGFATEKCRRLESWHQWAGSHDPLSAWPRAGPSSQVCLFPFRKIWVCLIPSVNSG